MPTLKQLTCTIEWAGSEVSLQEHATAYSDGFVQTYVAIPPASTAFTVHLTSSGYIAPGIAMFIYMDGIYQCNRNRRGLKMPRAGTRKNETEINLRVRQKEEKQENGTWLGKEWRFEKLNVEPSFHMQTMVKAYFCLSGLACDTSVADSLLRVDRTVPDHISVVSGNTQELQHLIPCNFDHLGTIEVVVLRCQPDSDPTITTLPLRPKSPGPFKHINKSTKSMQCPEPVSPAISSFGGFLDGAGDEPRCYRENIGYGLDGGWDEKPKENLKEEWGYSKTSATSGIYHAKGKPPGQVKGGVSGDQYDRRNQSYNHFSNDWGNPVDSHCRDGRRHATSVSGLPSPYQDADVRNNLPSPVLPSPPVAVEAHLKPLAWGIGISSQPAAPTVVIQVTTTPQPNSGGRGGQSTNYGVSHGEPPKRQTSQASIAQSRNGRPVDVGAGSIDSWASKRTDKDIRTDYDARKRDMGDQGAWKPPAGWAGENPNQADIWETRRTPHNHGTRPEGDFEKKNSSKASDRQPEDVGQQAGARVVGAAPSVRTYQTTQSSIERHAEWKKRQGRPENQVWKDTRPNTGIGVNWGEGCNPGNGWGNTNSKASADNSHGWQGAIAQPQSGEWGAGSAKVNADWVNIDASAKEPKNGHGNTNATSQWVNKSNSNTGNDDWNKNHEDDALDAKSKQGGHSASPAPNVPSSGWGKQIEEAYANNVAKQMGSWTDRVPPPYPPSIRSLHQEPCLDLNPVQVSSYEFGRSAKGSPTLPPSITIRGSIAGSRLTSPRSPYAQPYWASWTQAEQTPKHRPQIAEEAPLYTVPRDIIKNRSTSHQVQPGKPTVYLHKTHRPSYLDSHESPYAVFVFKYRSKEVLERLLNVSISEDRLDEKARLRALSKDQIIEELIKAKAASANGPSSKPVPVKDVNADPNSGWQKSPSVVSNGQNGHEINVQHVGTGWYDPTNGVQHDNACSVNAYSGGNHRNTANALNSSANVACEVSGNQETYYGPGKKGNADKGGGDWGGGEANLDTNQAVNRAAGDGNAWGGQSNQAGVEAAGGGRTWGSHVNQGVGEAAAAGDGWGGQPAQGGGEVAGGGGAWVAQPDGGSW
ncbi:MAG: hypothetical protein M1827_006906 [Pycnora praestabilis]|nr:MAG: hypothetical protein M1827_006906 [Pycnora praestabilis]